MLAQLPREPAYQRGSENPVEGLPVFIKGQVVHGFGRGSKQLGIPTANLPIEEYKQVIERLPVGVYYGWANVPSRDKEVYKVALSIGWNPFYKNKHKTLEGHIIHDYGDDFYSEEMRMIILGYIRPECDFPSLDSLIKAISDDIQYSKEALDKRENSIYRTHHWFTDPSTTTSPDVLSSSSCTTCTSPSSLHKANVDK